MANTKDRKCQCSVQLEPRLKDFIKYLQVKFSANGNRITVNDLIKDTIKKQYPNEFKSFLKMIKGE